MTCPELSCKLRTFRTPCQKDQFIRVKMSDHEPSQSLPIDINLQRKTATPNNAKAIPCINFWPIPTFEICAILVGVGDDTAEVTEFADEVLEEASLVVVKTEVLVTAFDEDAAVFARLAVVLPNENTFVNDVLPDDNTPGNDVVSPRVLNVGSGPNVAVAKGLTDTGLKIAQSFAIEIIVPGPHEQGIALVIPTHHHNLVDHNFVLHRHSCIQAMKYFYINSWILLLRMMSHWLVQCMLSERCELGQKMWWLLTPQSASWARPDAAKAKHEMISVLKIENFIVTSLVVSMRMIEADQGWGFAT